MRWLLLWLGLAALARVVADDTVVQEFSGSGSMTTASFTAPDGWEVRWNARRVVSVAVMSSSDGTIVAGGAGVLRGSLFLPLGGKYYFKVSDGETSPKIASPAPDSSPAVSEMSWHLQVVQLGPVGQDLTVYTPFFVPPDSSIAPMAAPPPVPKLTPDQARTVVMVQGDSAQGCGFFFKSTEGACVAVPLHLVEGNANLKLTTTAGTPIAIQGLKGALDRDLAFFSIQDASYNYLFSSADVSSITTLGDPLLIPAVSQGAEALATNGKLVGMGPGRVDFDNSLDASAVGAPVIHAMSGKVIAMASVSRGVDLSATLAKAWPANQALQSPGYFGVRIDDAHVWENYDPTQFLSETLFLHQFHIETRYLDSYLNAPQHHHHHEESTDGGPPDAHFFEGDTRISTANSHYQQTAAGGDRGQHEDSARQLLFDLQEIVDTDMPRLQAMKSAYVHNQNRMKEELAYRMALKSQLDGYQSDVSGLDKIAQSRSQ